ncbi:response regulator (plasmid) [Adhaeribacter swui]|uniref:Response regulator n=1 Tax=Adhaeribacter swui TaxID=2086471 RepID=A0A7G7G2J0_9BACT|nr:response regulator [Adhaeribacter swui]QNF31374.1 response regulator [Adhaeribacter swui]
MALLHKILVVDDDDISLFLATNLLKLLTVDVEVQTVSGAQQALDYLQAASQSGSYPELMLVEIIMEPMNGFEFMQAYRDSNRLNQLPIQIVFVSSNRQYRHLEQAQNFLDLDFIEKPLTPKNLAKYLA